MPLIVRRSDTGQHRRRAAPVSMNGAVPLPSKWVDRPLCLGPTCYHPARHAGAHGRAIHLVRPAEQRLRGIDKDRDAHRAQQGNTQKDDHIDRPADVAQG